MHFAVEILFVVVFVVFAVVATFASVSRLVAPIRFHCYTSLDSQRAEQVKLLPARFNQIVIYLCNLRKLETKDHSTVVEGPYLATSYKLNGFSCYR